MDKEEREMKITNVKDVNKFFDVIAQCEGKVELLTNEGDRLNLKSQLTKYVAIANFFSDGSVKELELVAYEPKDIDRLVNYMVGG